MIFLPMQVRQYQFAQSTSSSFDEFVVAVVDGWVRLG